MIKQYTLLVVCVLVFANTFAQVKDWKSENRHLIGINLIPISEEIFIPGRLSFNIAYGYQMGSERRLYTSVYYSKRNQDYFKVSQMSNFNLYTKIIKLGVQHNFNPKNRKYMQTLFGYCIGYAHYNISGSFWFGDNFNNTASIHYQQRFGTGFAEIQLGKLFKINKNLSVSTYLTTGVKTYPYQDPVLYRIPGMGKGGKSVFINFEIDLWYNFNTKKQ